ncbi:MAG TPA: citrate/2-methylcitrate synthase [Gemmatimonadota bacterium]|nr:citrate/2-methylcitrate synthase [Gemmatimonadota bacterium]
MNEPTVTTQPSAGGLEGVVVAESEISYVDGQEGRLVYRGFSIEDLAERSTFEETTKLLLDGELPSAAELATFRTALAAERSLDERTLETIRGFPADAEPMAALRTAVSALGLVDPDRGDDGPDATRRKAIRLIARLPGIVAACDRARRGEDPVPPREDLGHAASFLHQLRGQAPDPEDARILDICLILHAEHGMNASTFSARVTAATLSDIHSAVTSAIGTLKGPLHGGANQEVMKMLLEIDARGIEPAAHVRELLAAGRKVMGFGHRVYRTMDPRAPILRRFSKSLGERTGDLRWYRMSEEIVDAMRAEKGIDPNVDFFSASTYHALGIPADLFTPLFAIARVSGWAAHVEAQYARNRLIRPRAKYVGKRDLRYVPIGQRD